MRYATVDAGGALTGFYDDSVNTIPPGAIKLSDTQYAQWLMQQTGWIWSNGALMPAPAVTDAPASLSQQAAAALGAGFQVISTGTTAIDGTYGCDTATVSDVMAETVSILLTGNFTNGTQSLPFADQAGAMHQFGIDSFKAFAVALAAYVGALKAVAVTNSGTLPALPVTIA